MRRLFARLLRGYIRNQAPILAERRRRGPAPAAGLLRHSTLIWSWDVIPLVAVSEEMLGAGKKQEKKFSFSSERPGCFPPFGFTLNASRATPKQLDDSPGGFSGKVSGAFCQQQQYSWRPPEWH